ncbi:MAG: AMP-binding protein, partial [Gammaproteobacteria bacterium]|nr:AMP-binding protein [Gammaproteobacteria bacterium]
MSEYKTHAVDAATAEKAWIDEARYQQMYAQSIRDPEAFWDEQGRTIDWMRPYSKIRSVSYDPDNVSIKWYYDGTLNASYNCLDRHLESRGEQTAIIWEGDDPNDDAHITYRELHRQVCKLANAMKSLGIGKGDTVTLYMPMVPEAAVAMLACARIGAPHSVVFGGFSPDALAGRINDCQSKLVITADEGIRGGKTIPLKKNVDAALEQTDCVDKVLVVRRTGNDVGWDGQRDVWYHDAVGPASEACPPEEMSAEDPLFILYTSGSTGKPKGVQHTTGGYMVYASLTHKYVFDYHDNDVYWCTADVGWVTGHSY